MSSEGDPAAAAPSAGDEAATSTDATAAATAVAPAAVVRWLHGAEVLPNRDFYADNSKMRPSMEQLLTAKPNPVALKLPEDTSEAGDDNKGDAKGKEKPAVKFGWVEGVYMRCLLNIWGVMLFLRLTWVVGQAGLIQGLLLITLSNCVTVITTVSMSAVATNGQIGAGGIYYMISRSLGPEFGGAIGLMFTLANSIAVSMYTIGFCEALWDMLEQYISGFESFTGQRSNDIRVIGVATLILILGLALVGMEWVTRVQMGLLVLLIVSQVDFVVGAFLSPTKEEEVKGFVGFSLDVLKNNLNSAYTSKEGQQESFFTVFAVFFPAVTGIVAGANLSGDLKNPGIAIPKGTLLAIATTYCSYIVYAIIIACCCLRQASGVVEELNFGTDSFNSEMYPDITSAYTNCTYRDCKFGSLSQQMMEVVSAWGPLIYAGCFAATLSSAIASLVGAPRVFQAVAKDELFPKIKSFSKGYGRNNDPVRGYILVFIISLVCILIGDLNIVSSLLSNFFVAAYALINFSVFHGDITNSPGWRPAFRYYNKWLSLIGTLLCVVVMFLMDYITALITFLCIAFLYMYVSVRAPNVNWGSSTQSQSFILALQAVQNLSKVEGHVKNFRPNILLFCGNPGDRPTLIDFARLFSKKRSLLQCVRIIDDSLDLRRKRLAEDIGNNWFQSNDVKAFFHVNRAKSFSAGVSNALELCGLGKMRANIAMLGFRARWSQDYQLTAEYFDAIRMILSHGMGIGLLRLDGGLDTTKMHAHNKLLSTLSREEGEDGGGSSSSSGEEEEVEGDERGRLTKTSSRADDVTFAIPLLPMSLISHNPLNPENRRTLDKLRQFRGNSRVKQGTIDVYWLFDDGGLTILLPHLLRSTLKFSKCSLRIFILPQSDDLAKAVQRETKEMLAMLAAFRIDVMTVAVLKDLASSGPTKASEEDFSRLLGQAQERAFKRLSKQGEDVAGGREALTLLTESALAANAERTAFHLRLAEVVREKSGAAAAVVMTLPLPMGFDSADGDARHATPPMLYMAWLDFLSRGLPPFLFVRGSQESVLTFYS